MNERDIQLMLWHNVSLRGMRIYLPNVYLYAWESDFLAITNAGRVHEFEIKVTKADFKVDAAKEKHLHLSGIGQYTGYRHRVAGGTNGRSIFEHDPSTPRKVQNRPNFFWYCVPTNLADIVVPEYAGLIVCNGRPEIIKDAPLLHKDKLDEKHYPKLLKKLCPRFMDRIRH